MLMASVKDVGLNAFTNGLITPFNPLIKLLSILREIEPHAWIVRWYWVQRCPTNTGFQYWFLG